MTTILWTIYLSFTIWIALAIIFDLRFDLFADNEGGLGGWLRTIITTLFPILMAIWYMYFLH